MQSAYAFILMGPAHTDENTLGGTMIPAWSGPDGILGTADDIPQDLANGGAFTDVNSSNMIDDLGGPKHIKEFYRWNTPHLVYGFDREFVRFFGEEGILAVNDAMRVLNDFFQPQDGQYSGVSELDLMRHGFGGNYSTYWLNVTAKNENLMDIKSLVLGMMVNYLGLGNPYRHMFSTTNAWYADPLNAGSVVFGTTLKNFDPITLQPTDWVNGDQYAYRLIHNQVPGFLPDPTANAGAGNVAGVTLDMEEYTNSDTVNTYSAVSAIVDAFYGNTDLVWTRVPSRYGFGIYYDGLNAMGGSYKPRHALTYDDAGGLKYMYNTNTVVMEFNPYAMVKPADFTKTLQRYNLAPYSDPLRNRLAGVFPTRNNRPSPSRVAQSHPLFTFMDPHGPGADGVYGTQDDLADNLLTRFMTGANPSFVVQQAANPPKTPGKMAWAFRGGIDSIQFHEISYDSLLNMSHYATNFTWTDTFMTNASIRAPVMSTVTNTTPGASIDMTDSLSHYYQQTLTRSARSPDFIFSASKGLSTQTQVQTAWVREAPQLDGSPFPGPTPGTAAPAQTTRFSALEYNRLYYTESAGFAGPGIWAGQPGPYGGGTATGPYDINLYDGLHMVFNSSINIGGFEVVWSGESSVVGNQIPPIQYQQWAWIKGPGVNDFTKFPQDYDIANRLIENTILPIAGVPVITMVSDNGGLSSIAPTSLSRTEEMITMIGTGFLAATAIEVVDPSGAVVQVFSPADLYVKHDKLIEIPADTFSYKSEGLSRQIRVWNPVGQSELSNEKFNINTGRPRLFGTSSDGVLYDRTSPLTLFGSGFKSKRIHVDDGNSTITHLRVDDLTSAIKWPVGGLPFFGNDVSIGLEIISDKKAILHGGVLPASIDTQTGVRVRVSRGNISSVSPTTETFIPGVSGQPEITGIKFLNDETNLWVDVDGTAAGALRRDATIIIDGFGLGSATSVELIDIDGAAFSPIVLADLLNKGNKRSDGTRITLQIDAFSESSADGHGPAKAMLRIVNPFGVTKYSTAFNVNIQPSINVGLTGPSQPPIPSETLYDSLITSADGKIWNCDSSATGNGMALEFDSVDGGLKAISRIHIINDGAAQTETGAYLDVPGPGIRVTDKVIAIDPKVAVWKSSVSGNGIKDGQSVDLTDWKRFKLVSARNPAFSGPQPDRVIIGKPPVISDYYIAGSSVERDYQRDNPAHEIRILGSDMQLVEYVEVVDKGGATILTPSVGDPSYSWASLLVYPYSPPVIPAEFQVQMTKNLQLPDASTHLLVAGGAEIQLKQPMWDFHVNLGWADTIAGPSAQGSGLGQRDGRRLRVVNVFSTFTPTLSSDLDTFTQSAKPDLTHDLSLQFNQEVYHGGVTGTAQNHWIDTDGVRGDPAMTTVGLTSDVIITVNPNPAAGGVPPPPDPTLSGSLMGVRKVTFEHNRGGTWVAQKLTGPPGGLPFTSPPLPGTPAAPADAVFIIDEHGDSQNGAIRINSSGRHMTLSRFFIMAFNVSSTNPALGADRAAASQIDAGPVWPAAGNTRDGRIDDVLGTADDLGYWNENTPALRAPLHRIKFETVAGAVAYTTDSADGNPPVNDNGGFLTYVDAMETGTDAFVQRYTGPGFIAGANVLPAAFVTTFNHWERDKVFQIDGQGIGSATHIRFVNADMGTPPQPFNARYPTNPSAPGAGDAGGPVLSVRNPYTGATADHEWKLIDGVVGTGIWVGPGPGGGANEFTVHIAGDHPLLANDGHVVDSGYDNNAELRRVQFRFADMTTVTASDTVVPPIAICRPLDFITILHTGTGPERVQLADDVFQDNTAALGEHERQADGLYFSKYDTFGFRAGEFLRVNSRHNNMKGVARIDFVDGNNQLIHRHNDFVGTDSGLHFSTLPAHRQNAADAGGVQDDLGNPRGNPFHGFVAHGDDVLAGNIAPNGALDNWDVLMARPPVPEPDPGMGASSFLYLPADNSGVVAGAAGPVPDVNGVFSDPRRSGWFEGGNGDELIPNPANPATLPTSRMLRFTMRSGRQFFSPLIRAGRAPTMLGLDTGAVNLPLQVDGSRSWHDPKTLAVPPGRFTGDVPTLGNFAFNRNEQLGDAQTNIQFDATDVNQTSFRAIWMELSDDRWPFGDPFFNGNTDGDRDPALFPAGTVRPGDVNDDFAFIPQLQYQSPGGANVFINNPAVALNLPLLTNLVAPASNPGNGGGPFPWRSEAMLNIIFNANLFDTFAELDTPGDAEIKTFGGGFQLSNLGAGWTVGNGVPGFNTPGGSPAPGAGGVHSQGDHDTTFTSAVRSSRQVVLETLFGQASSYRELAPVHPGADGSLFAVVDNVASQRKVLSVSHLWDFHTIALTAPYAAGGFQPLQVGHMQAGELNRAPAPGGAPLINAYGVGGVAGIIFRSLIRLLI